MPGRDKVIVSISSAAMAPSRAALAAASASAWWGCPPGTSLTAMSVTMSQDLAEPVGDRRRGGGGVDTAIGLEKPVAGLEDASPRPRSRARAASAAFDPEHRREPGVVFAGDAGIGRRREPADRGRRQCDRLRRLRRVEMQQPRRGNRGGEDRDEAAVKALAAKARRDRFADPPRRLVAEHDRGQHLFAAGAAALGDRQARRGQGCAGMDDVAQIAVVAGRGVAHHRVDLRRVGERKFRAVVEPDRGVGPPAALARQACG